MSITWLGTNKQATCSSLHEFLIIKVESLLQAKLVRRKIHFLDLELMAGKKDFGRKRLMYKMRRDGYTLLYYLAQLKLTLWKSPNGEHIYMMKKRNTVYS